MIKRVFVGIDFSESSRDALQRAAGWAAQLRLPLTAVHVVELPKYSFAPPYAALGDPTWFKDLHEQIEKQLNEWLLPYPGATTLIKTGSPADVLVKEADPETLLVVGQVGHSKLEHLLFGSTAARVARHAPCDVLVVRAEPRAD